MKQRMAILAAPPFAPGGLADMEEIWGNEVEISLFSVLAERTSQAISPYLPEEGDRILMYVLEDGAHTRISIDKLTPRFEELLAGLQGQADFALLACGGDFPKLASPLPLIQPNVVLRNMVKGMLQPKMRLGVITPEKMQVSHVFASWQPYLAEAGLAEEQLVVDWAPPSQGIETITNCAKRLAAKNVDLVVVECLGFKEELRKVISEEVKKPVILVRTVVANLVKELTSSM